jgi:hypothetical protein
MSTKAAHTPTPYEFDAMEQAIYSMSGGHLIAKLAIRPKVVGVDDIESFGLSIETKANADLIVTAVNSHQELLTRLYNLRNSAYVAISAGKITQELEHFYAEADETLKKIIK